MKTKYPNDAQFVDQSGQFTGRRRTIPTLFSTLLAGFMFATLAAQAANILVNPGFESTPIFSTWAAQTTEGWSMNSATSQGSLIRTGANALWTQGLYGNGGAGRYFNMYAFQKIAAPAGATYTADAWFSAYTYYPAGQGGDNGAGSGLLTSDADGVEDCWVEVQFLDSGNNILADYKSVILSPINATLPGSAGVKTLNVTDPSLPTVTDGNGNIHLAWLHCPVTNQFDVSTIGPNTDPATESVTNTLSTGVMTAPPGTAYVQYMLCLAQALYESGANYWDDCTLIQQSGPSASVVSGITPDGTQFFNTNKSVSFNVTSASQGGFPLPTNPTNGIHVTVNGVDHSAGLQFSGTLTNWSVILPNVLVSNVPLYEVTITVNNSAGLITTANVSFDTLQPSIIVPVETFDYDSGQFIQNPIPSTNNANSYFGRAGVLGTDMQAALAGGSSLAPNYPNRTDLAESFEVASDTQLPLYQSNPGVYTVDHAYNNAGQWFNYTRNPYPAGNVQVWARVSGGQGAGSELLNILTSGYGTATQTTNNLGEFDMPNPNLYNGPQGTDWTKYYWVPLTDKFGNLIPVNVPSGRQTLQLLSSPIAGENVICFIITAFPTTGVPPSILNINPPNGTVFAPAAAGFSFTAAAGAGSGGATVSSSGISLTLNGANVTSGLNFSGSGPINVTYSNLVANTIYTAVISVTNSVGAVATRTVTFDTLSTSNFYVKIDDFDHDSGQWDTVGNGLVPNAYLGQNNNITNIDYYHAADGGGNFPYRGPAALAQETTSDTPLPGYSAGSDYDVGNFNGGDWGNFTRNYPAGKFYVYGRLAGFSGNVTLSRVTSGQGTTNQILQALGTCPTSTANQGWANWNWCLLQNNGIPAVVNVGGTNTLRVTSGGNVNANYFMLVPLQGITISVNQVGSNIVISFPTVAGSSYRVFYKPSLTGGTWSLLTSVPGNGTVKSVSDPVGPNPRFYQVTSP